MIYFLLFLSFVQSASYLASMRIVLNNAYMPSYHLCLLNNITLSLFAIRYLSALFKIFQCLSLGLAISAPNLPAMYDDSGRVQSIRYCGYPITYLYTSGLSGNIISSLFSARYYSFLLYGVSFPFTCTIPSFSSV